jgi:hypothetical protein
MRMPFLSVRAVAVLMLLAGLSLGVFAARALHAGRTPTAAPVLDQAIEVKVDLYRQYYRLDAAQADRVRQTLKDFDVGTVSLYRELREQNPTKFAALRQEMDARIQTVLEEAAAGRK